MSKRRSLRPDEAELWNKVAKSVDPLRKSPAPTERSDAKPVPKRTVPTFTLDEITPTPQAAASKNGYDLAPTIANQIENAPLRMDRKTFSRMKRGALSPEARIDLHGMTQERAHPALSRFILRAHSEGKRLVLVITGKGKVDRGNDLIPVRTGVLRHQVPHWLTVPPLSHAVLQVTNAHQKHGGGGAYYVYLRRTR